LLGERGQVEVIVNPEPPLRWPLWFSNEIGDNEEAAPITEALKVRAHSLHNYIESNATWASDADQYRWKHPDNSYEFNSLIQNFAVDLSAELGAKYKIRFVRSSPSSTGYICLKLDK